MADPKIAWPSPPPDISLTDKSVHVWAIGLNPSAEVISQCRTQLSSDESERAARFRFERDQRRFTMAHAALRDILSRYTSQPREALRFMTTQRGKPLLEIPTGQPPLHFNLSHSDELAFVAVTRICPVGVDVERIRELSDADGIASRFFSERESRGLAALPAGRKPAAFFNLWTRKEAWLKATGVGISEHLDRVEVSFLSGEAARLIALPDSTDSPSDWSLIELHPANGFAGALAIRSPSITLNTFSWSIR